MFFNMDIENREKKEFNLLLAEWHTVCSEVEKQTTPREEPKKMFKLMTREEYKKRDKEAEIIPLIKMDSSNVIAMGFYDGYLYVMFNTRIVYKYKYVPLQIVDELFRANENKKSLGKLFNLKVKKAGYVYEQINSELYKGL